MYLYYNVIYAEINRLWKFLFAFLTFLRFSAFFRILPHLFYPSMFYAIKSPRARRTPEYVPVITPDVGLLNLVVYSHSGTQPGLCCAVPDVLMVYRRFSFPVYSAVLCAAVAIPASQPAGCCTRRPCLMGRLGDGNNFFNHFHATRISRKYPLWVTHFLFIFSVPVKRKNTAVSRRTADGLKEHLTIHKEHPPSHSLSAIGKHQLQLP